MAIAYVRLDAALMDHLKLRKLAELLNCWAVTAVGLLAELWLFGINKAPDGRLKKFSDEVIAAGAGWPNEAQKFVDALVDSGFLDRDESGSLSFHDWADNCALSEQALMAKRSKAARDRARQRSGVSGKKAEAEASDDTAAAVGLSPRQDEQLYSKMILPLIDELNKIGVLVSGKSEPQIPVSGPVHDAAVGKLKALALEYGSSHNIDILKEAAKARQHLEDNAYGPDDNRRYKTESAMTYFSGWLNEAVKRKDKAVAGAEPCLVPDGDWEA